MRRRARSAVRHHTLVGGDDGYTETATNFRQIIDGLVLAQTWTASAFYFFDDRTAFEIFQLDGQLRLNFTADLITRNITFVFQNFGYMIGWIGILLPIDIIVKDFFQLIAENSFTLETDDRIC